MQMMIGPSHSSNHIDKNNGKAGNGIDIHSGRSKVHNVQMRMNAIKGSRIHTNYFLATMQIFPPGNTSINTSANTNTTPSRKNGTQTQTSSSGTKQDNYHMSLYTPTPTPTSARDSYRHAHADDASIHSFASAPTPTMIRSPLPKPMLKIDVLHSNKAGTTFRSNSNAETHEERVDRDFISCFWISKRFNQKEKNIVLLETCSMMSS